MNGHYLSLLVFLCLFNFAFHAETCLDPNKIRRGQNAETRLQKPVLVCWPVKVNEMKTLICQLQMKTKKRLFPTNLVINYRISFCVKSKEILNTSCHIVEDKGKCSQRKLSLSN